MRSSNANRGVAELEAIVRRALREELLRCSSSNPDELMNSSIPMLPLTSSE